MRLGRAQDFGSVSEHLSEHESGAAAESANCEQRKQQQQQQQ